MLVASYQLHVNVHVLVNMASYAKKGIKVYTTGGSSVVLSSPASVSDESTGPRCLNLSSTESILGVITSYLESFCIKEH